MDPINTILVPHFVHVLLDKQRCDRCEKALDDAWIKSAGIRLNGDNEACFFAKVWCRHCEAPHDYTFTSHKFVRDDWWYDLAAWTSDAARPDRVGTFLSTLKLMPGLPVLLRERGKVRKLDLFGAYSGNAGPVLIIYRKVASHPSRPYGIARLEKRDRLKVLPVDDKEFVPVSKWAWFQSLQSGASFESRGRRWQKLSFERTAEIVRDRVFEPWTKQVRQASKTVRARPKR